MISFLIDGRRAFFWIVFFLIALSANAFALVLQYGFDIQPCVKCIDQRIALYLVAISSLLAIIIPKHTFTFTLARIAALSSMAYSLYLSYLHFYEFYLSDMPSTSCSFEPSLPSWLPLHEWIPALFEVKGMCGKTEWTFLGYDLVAHTFFGLTFMAVLLLAGLIPNDLLLKKKG